MDKSYLSYGNIVQISLESAPNQTIHWHDSLEIILVLEGTTRIHVSFERIELSKDQMMVINSSEPHRIYDSSDQSMLMCVKLSKEYCYSIHSNLYEALAVSDFDVTFKNLNDNKELLTSNIFSLVKLLSGIEGVNESNNEAVYDKIKTLLNNLVASYMPKLSFEYLAKKVPDEKIEMIHRMIRYLYDNYDQEVNLQTFSDQEFFNFYYVSHNIKEITGTSFRDWLNYVRVEHSEKLLLTTDKSITTISEECGFSDVRYYNKHFYKWHNVTPSGFRRLFKQSYTASQSLSGGENTTVRIPDQDIAKYFVLTKQEKKEFEAFNDIHIAFDKSQNKASKQKIEKLVPGRFECNEDQLIYPAEWDNLSKLKEDMKTRHLYININLYENYLGLSHSEIRNFVRGINYLAENGVTPVLCVSITDDIGLCIKELQKVLKSIMRQTTMIKTFHLEVSVVQDDLSSNEKAAVYKSFREKALQGFPNMIIKRKKAVAKRNIRRLLESPVILSNIISPSGLKTYQYYFCSLMANMDKSIIDEGDNYIVCGGRDRLSVIIYQNTPEEVRCVNYHLNITDANCSYKIVKYKQSLRDYGFNRIIQNNKVIESFSPAEKELFNRMTFPKICFDYLEESQNHELTLQIEENGILLCDIIRI